MKTKDNFKGSIKSPIILFIFGLIFLQFPGSVHSAIPASERAALIALYNSTNGDSWANKSGWKTPPLHTDGFAMPGTEGGWYGVKVSTGQCEISLPVQQQSE